MGASVGVLRKNGTLEGNSVIVGGSSIIESSEDHIVRSPVKKSAILRGYITSALQQNIFFEAISNKLASHIIDVFAPVKYKAGDIVHDLNSMYVVEYGLFEATKRGHDSNIIIYKCGEGDAFGEQNLLLKAESSMKYRCLEDGVVWKINRQTFRHIRTSSVKQDSKFILNVLRSMTIFKELDEYQLSLVSEVATIQSYDSGDYIIKKNEIGDAFFIIIEGEAQCSDAKFLQNDKDKAALGREFVRRSIEKASSTSSSKVVMAKTSSLMQDETVEEEKNPFDEYEKARKLEMTSSCSKIDSGETDEILQDVSNKKEKDRTPASAPISFHGYNTHSKASPMSLNSSSSSSPNHITTTGVATSEMDQQQRHVMKSGQWFGEIALISGCVRTANVIALTKVRVAVFDKHAFEKVLGNLKDIMEKETNNKMLSSLPIIMSLPKERREHAVNLFTIETYKDGDTIARTGDYNPRFILIKSGRAHGWHHPLTASTISTITPKTGANLLVRQAPSPKTGGFLKGLGQSKFPTLRLSGSVDNITPVSNKSVTPKSNKSVTPGSNSASISPKVGGGGGGVDLFDFPTELSNSDGGFTRSASPEEPSYPPPSLLHLMSSSCGEEENKKNEGKEGDKFEGMTKMKGFDDVAYGDVIEPSQPPPSFSRLYIEDPTDISEPSMDPPPILMQQIQQAAQNISNADVSSAAQEDRMFVERSKGELEGGGGGGGEKTSHIINSIVNKGRRPSSGSYLSGSVRAKRVELYVEESLSSFEMTSFSKSFGLTELGMKESKWRTDVIANPPATTIGRVPLTNPDIDEGDESSGSNKEEDFVRAMEESLRHEKEEVKAKQKQAKSDMERILMLNEVGNGCRSDSENSSSGSMSSSSFSSSSKTKLVSCPGIPKRKSGEGEDASANETYSSSNHQVTTEKAIIGDPGISDSSSSNVNAGVSASAGSMRGVSRGIARIEASTDRNNSLPSPQCDDGTSSSATHLLTSKKDKSTKKARRIVKLNMDELGAHHYYLNIGEHVGEECIIDGTPMDTTVIACGDVTCFILTRTDLISLLNETHINEHIEKTNLINEMFIKKAAIRSQQSLEGGARLSRGDKISRARRSDTLNREGANFGVVSKEPPKVSWSDLSNIGELGAGTFGTVYLMADKKDEAKYALKVIQLKASKSNKHEMRVKTEIRILQRVNSPFISKVYLHARHENSYYLLMEFVEGGDMRRLIYSSDKAKRIKQRQAVLRGEVAGMPHQPAKFYTAAVSIPLLYLHRRGYAYRDLKPENVMIDRYGYPKLVDFGLSKSLETSRKTYTLCGTAEYLAPEILLGEGYNQGVDWWALGVLLYEMVVGITPFAQRNVPRNEQDQMKIFENIIQNQVQYPSGMEPGCRLLIQQLLVSKYVFRINCGGRRGHKDFEEHDWFKNEIDWFLLNMRSMTPPWIPQPDV